MLDFQPDQTIVAPFFEKDGVSLISRNIFLSISETYRGTYAFDISSESRNYNVLHAETVRRLETWTLSAKKNLFVYNPKFHNLICQLITDTHGDAHNVLYVPYDYVDAAAILEFPQVRISACLTQRESDEQKLRKRFSNVRNVGTVVEPSRSAQPICDSNIASQHALNALVLGDTDVFKGLFLNPEKVRTSSLNRRHAASTHNAALLPWKAISAADVRFDRDEISALDTLQRCRCLILTSGANKPNWHTLAATVLAKPIFDVRKDRPETDELSAAAVPVHSDLDARSDLPPETSLVLM